MEEEIKKFLEEECEKYKHITWCDNDEDYQARRTMDREMRDFFYNNYKEINKMSNTALKEIEDYAVELGGKFNNQCVAHHFWYDNVMFTLQSLPMDK